jgi:hypothetical protein
MTTIDNMQILVDLGFIDEYYETIFSIAIIWNKLHYN